MMTSADTATGFVLGTIFGGCLVFLIGLAVMALTEPDYGPNPRDRRDHHDL